ncbi:MAG: hypothetical protein K2H04_02715 [Bacteroidaceae bacterium]|nr:hypothetical protein [Bacteroidaceae bacterium]
MSPTSTNRSPRHRPTDVGDSDLEAVEAHHSTPSPTIRKPSKKKAQSQETLCLYTEPT